ncbi:MAG: hypothetical protein JHC34_04695 [Acidobacteria bacterium]|nr:hypothetical protein [Acidobacteriota bacterium]
MARVKGTVIASTLAFLNEKLGKDGTGRLIEGLGAERSALLKGPVLQGNWYPVDLLIKLVTAAEGKVAVPGGRTLAWELGRYSADTGLKGIYKVFFKMADISFILKRAPGVWASYYDSGMMQVLVAEPNKAIMRIAGFDQPSAILCDRVLGWMERTVEMSGGKRVVMSHPACAARGDDFCEYRGEWE